MGQKHKKNSGILDAISPAWHPQKSSQYVRACAKGDGAICATNRKIVLYHGDSPNTRNSVRLRSPSPIMAPGQMFIGTRPHTEFKTPSLYGLFIPHDCGKLRWYDFCCVEYIRSLSRLEFLLLINGQRFLPTSMVEFSLGRITSWTLFLGVCLQTNICYNPGQKGWDSEQALPSPHLQCW